MPVSTGVKLARADLVITVLLLLGQGDRGLSSPTGFDGQYYPPFEISEGEVQSGDTLCPLVELPEAFNGQVQSYSIDPMDDNIHISMRNVILTPCLQNSVSLDRDVRASYSFILTAIASDGTGRDSINITLHLLDVNDNPPSFHPNTTSATYVIPENAAVHDSVGPGPILAQDPDEGANGTVRYWLEGCSDIFQIHNSTGLITLKAGPLDRETKDSYSCKVTASDLAVHDPRSTSWDFVIDIADVNDNAPQCSNGLDSFFFNVTENAMEIKLLCSGITDGDLGRNGTVSEMLTLANASLSSNISAVSSVAGVRALTLTVSGLDREVLGPSQDRYLVQLYATDEGTPPQTSTLYVILFVEDVNDTPPQFEGPSVVVIFENHASDQPVVRVHFTDLDLHSELTYNLQQSTRGQEDILTAANVSITNDGDIFISNTTFLDYDSLLPPEIILTVEVSDGVHTTVSNVTLRITDVNDNSPVFEHSVYSLMIEENVALDTPVGNVTARDADSGSNGAIRYTILNTTHDTPFVISESTGEITTSGPIDRELVESYNIEVMAEDRGTQRRQDVLQVIITVLDQDDNCPEFTEDEYTIVYERDNMQGTIGVVSATDKDSAAFNKVIYSLDRVVHFEIDENTGNVSLRGNSQPSQNITLLVTATAASVEGPSANCSSVSANLVIVIYSQQPSATPPTPGGSSATFITIIAGAVPGALVLCIVVVVGIAVTVICCCVRISHSKQYNVNNFSPATSPSEKETATKTKSILKSYHSEGTDGKQKNSVRFVEVIEKSNVHLFQSETPISSPELANGHLPQQQPRGNHCSELSIDSSSCEEDLSHFLPSDYSDQQDQSVTAGHMNECYEMETRPPGYRPPTPPLSLHSREEHIPLQELSFTSRKSEGSASLPRNGYYTHHHPGQQLSWSASSYHPPTHRNGADLPQRRSGTSFLSESGTSLTSDDRDSSSADLDNFSTYTEQGTDIMTQVPGPMENLFSNLQQSSMLQRYAGGHKGSPYKDSKPFEHV